MGTNSMNNCIYNNIINNMRQCVNEIEEFDFENATEDETNAFEKFYDLCLEVANDYNRNDFTKQKN
jgi:hypothetical protein